MKEEFIPILLASDINVYSMARAFHEEYKVKSIVLARNTSGIINHSKIIEYREVKDLDENQVFLKTMNNLYKELKTKKKKLILIGCADHYVRLIVTNKDKLKDKFILPYTNLETLNKIVLKETFYELCEKNNIDYPKTHIYKKGDSLDFKLDFDYPVILKPSDSVLYFKASFPGQYKVYTINSKEELDETLKKIYDAGYLGNMIIQDRIPGYDNKMYDLHVFVGKSKKVEYMNLGNVLLEEHTPKGLGSNAATITVYNEELMLKIKNLLESIGYEGWCDCDLKYDERDNKIKIFEINIRQGRSHYRNTGSGYNVAKYIVDSYINNIEKDLLLVKEPYFWHVIPKKIVLDYVEDKEKLALVKKLIKEGKVCHSLFYKEDKSFKRNFYLIMRNINQFKKYKKYYKKDLD
ncbi:MAG: hypothetical protein IJ501_03505 [Bacilli bacterium]|nr:hypothetical protein [Bacilli bacterium]